MAQVDFISHEKGAILVEMLASLSIILVLCSIIVPQLILLQKEEKHTRMRHYANEMIREQIIAMLDHTSKPSSIVKAGVTYYIVVENSYESSDKRICISWYDLNHHKQSRCERVRDV